ncbi:hypothetical protein [Stenotrophomonas sp. SMYL20]|uniref:hypothetical protein n=1 Tax=Stenotrophomonas sp. SMYL20 TaxID=3076043 RepID=UPI002E79461B|nr:hypothetical protein [Stenotrophomonas sp. SMYL20]
MSNDNKTLADVQPGGRVRLGDAWAIKLAREAAFAHSSEHAYLPQTREETNSWQPHEWVVAAIQTVATSVPKPRGQEPITVEAVAEIFNDPEYGLSISWLLENGIGELQVGDVLIVANRAITDEDGSGEVYAAPPAKAVDLAPLVSELAEADREYTEAKNKYHTVSAKMGAAGGRASCRAAYDREVAAKARLDAAVRALIDSQAVGNG